jgi:hypothetical protein
MTEPTLSIEHELLRDGLLFDDIEVVEQKINPTVGDDDLHVVMTLQADQELLGSSVFGLAYVLAVLSFADARPRGTSGKWSKTTTSSPPPICFAT